ncbi:hypothetical protein H5410_050699 [Solanum commersonii]|uniref:Uncharacterized protein n=1 Tax=Solanum commersonii TaxID=4109 RepID=A0A9J5WYQ1_SOLCO|nr:hypothetical protein H5410_050699 [Solanum commersonii]
MTEVKNLLLERRKLISSPPTISDLKQEIKISKMIFIIWVSSESSSYEEDSKDLDFLKTLNFGTGRGNILAQVGNQKLIATNIASTSGLNANHLMYMEFLDFMQSKQRKDNIPQSYSTILTDEENIEIFDQNDKKEVILLLEQSDLRWKNDPSQIMHIILNSLDHEMVCRGKIHGQEIIDLINTTMDKYQNIERSKPQVDDLSPFKQIA